MKDIQSVISSKINSAVWSGILKSLNDGLSQMPEVYTGMNSDMRRTAYHELLDGIQLSINDNVVGVVRDAIIEDILKD